MLRIEPNAIHLWWAVLDRPEKEEKRLAALLVDEERQRAGRFFFANHRRRFVAAHGMLRALLGAYLDMAPQRIPVRRTDSGKPYLEKTANPGGICFNLSHSHGMALYGFSTNRRIGVDIEYCRETTDIVKIAERFFPAGQADRIASASGQRRRELFFRSWSVKEACLKATGQGIGGLREMEMEDFSEKNWMIRPVAIRPGYAAAVAVEQAFDAELIVQQVSFPDLMINNAIG